jgi:hypothetical protein
MLRMQQLQNCRCSLDHVLDVLQSEKSVGSSSACHSLRMCCIQVLCNGHYVGSVSTSVVVCMQVQPGDVLLAGSDGLWDNCYESELLQLLPDQAEGAAQVGPWTLLDCMRCVQQFTCK